LLCERYHEPSARTQAAHVRLGPFPVFRFFLGRETSFGGWRFSPTAVFVSCGALCAQSLRMGVSCRFLAARRTSVSESRQCGTAIGTASAEPPLQDRHCRTAIAGPPLQDRHCRTAIGTASAEPPLQDRHCRTAIGAAIGHRQSATASGTASAGPPSQPPAWNRHRNPMSAYGYNREDLPVPPMASPRRYRVQTQQKVGHAETYAGLLLLR